MRHTFKKVGLCHRILIGLWLGSLAGKSVCGSFTSIAAGGFAFWYQRWKVCLGSLSLMIIGGSD